jgi:hypothetical protein
MLCDLRFFMPVVTAGARWRPGVLDGVRTRRGRDDHDHGRLRSLRARTPAALGLRDRGRDRPAVSGWPFLPWEGLEGGRWSALAASRSGLRQGPAVLRRLVATPQIGLPAPIRTISGDF